MPLQPQVGTTSGNILGPGMLISESFIVKSDPGLPSGARPQQESFSHESSESGWSLTPLWFPMLKSSLEPHQGIFLDFTQTISHDPQDTYIMVSSDLGSPQFLRSVINTEYLKDWPAHFCSPTSSKPSLGNSKNWSKLLVNINWLESARRHATNKINL